jgi:hypothetical protein
MQIPTFPLYSISFLIPLIHYVKTGCCIGNEEAMGRNVEMIGRKAILVGIVGEDKG